MAVIWPEPVFAGASKSYSDCDYEAEEGRRALVDLGIRLSLQACGGYGLFDDGGIEI